MALIHLGCPTCAGPVTLSEGQRLVRCVSCGSAHLALIPGQTPRYAVGLEIDRRAAEEAVASLLAGPALPDPIRGRVRPRDLRLYYVPFYEVSGVRLGAIQLCEEGRPRPDGKDAEPAEGPRAGRPEARTQGSLETHILEQEWMRVLPACDHAELGVAAIPLPRLRRDRLPVRLEAFDPVALQARGVVLAPTAPPPSDASEAGGALRVAGDRTQQVERRLRLLYYPVWHARYLFRGRLYGVALDGVSGGLLLARTPGDLRPASAGVALALGVVALGFGQAGRGVLLEALGRGAGFWAAAAGLGVGLLGGGALGLTLAWMLWRALQRPEAAAAGGAG
jgi:hypothetical protein